MQNHLLCPHCGTVVTQYLNPAPTTDVIVYDTLRGVVLIERGNPPYGHALPGGFIDVGESAEQAAVREMREETGLVVTLTGLLGVYSDPRRDARRHTISIVFTATAQNPEQLCAGDDAAQAAFFPIDALPQIMAFDHRHILDDFLRTLDGSHALAPVQDGK